jgi:hypothetical protein
MQVFKCEVFACHKFYHVCCIIRKLVCEDKENFVYEIYYGMKMISCHIQKCKLCDEVENKNK